MLSRLNRFTPFMHFHNFNYIIYNLYYAGKSTIWPRLTLSVSRFQKLIGSPYKWLGKKWKFNLFELQILTLTKRSKDLLLSRGHHIFYTCIFNWRSFWKKMLFKGHLFSIILYIASRIWYNLWSLHRLCYS